MSKVVPIRIRKHTPVRRPKSTHIAFARDVGGVSAQLQTIRFRQYFGYPLVTDLTRKRQTVSKVPKYDWTHGITQLSNEPKKETLWQRIKRHYKEGLTE